jgi:hypothetical protein
VSEEMIRDSDPKLKRKYTKETSEARRHQLDELKQRRRRTRTEMLLDAAHAEPRRSVVPTRAQVVAEVQRQAMGGVMPKAKVFNFAKPALWPTAAEILIELGMTWAELADEAGLRATVVFEVESIVLPSMQMEIAPLADFWPELDDVPEGVDMFSQYPVSGGDRNVV